MMASTANIALTCLAAVVVYPIYTAIYNIFFHPLRNYPGPKLNAVTRLPFIITLLKGENHLYIQSLHQRYGDVVRVNPDELAYTSDVWRDIYGHRTGGKGSFEKDPIFLGPDLVGHNGLIRARGDANHARIRKVFSNAFSDRALKDQQPIFQQYVDQLIASIHTTLAADPDAALPISDLYNFTTFDIMGDLTFGEPLGLLANSRYTDWVAAIFGSLQLVIIGRIFRWYPSLNTLLQLLLPAGTKAKRARQVSHTLARIDNRLARGSSARPDIWTCVLQNSARDLISTPEMQSSASTFMIAGTETTATLLSGLTHLLLLHPPALSRLTHEIRTTFPTPASVADMSALARLAYLRACIDEALRIYPPVPTGLPRVVPAGGAVVGGGVVAGGTVVSISNYAAFRAPGNFHRADEFCPERWLEGRDPVFDGDRREVCQPFSYGPRNCLGKSLAYHEMRLVLAKVLWHFDLEELCEESRDWMRQRTFGLWEKPVLRVRLRARAD